MEHDPHKVFERLFGQGTTADERKTRGEEFSSILDAVSGEAASLGKTLGAADKARLGDYLESVREIERRIQRMGKGVSADLTLPEIAAGVPEAFDERITLMFDLAALAYQTNVTRVFSMMMTREASNITYNHIGVPDAFHPVSHHQNNAQKMAKLVKIQTYHCQVFAKFLTKLKNTPDGDGSLLDHSLIMYGTNMGDSNQHLHYDVPHLLVGGAGGKLKGGRHLSYPTKTVTTGNLLLSILEMYGIHQDSIGDSNGHLTGLA
jgi:hypothetical protein